MSMMAPDPEDFDWASLEAQLDFETQEVLDVTQLNDVDLLSLERTLVEELKAREEMLNVRTDRGREVQSLRAAARIELAKRGIK